MKAFLERQFRLSELGTTLWTEILAGLTTFATMAYVLAVVPKILSETGLPRGEVLTAMVILIVLTTLAMGFYTNRPFVLAPGLGSVAIFSITLVQIQHVSLGIACALVFFSGILFLAVTLLGIRDAIVNIIPKGVKISISAGVGLFITVIGMRIIHLISANSKKAALTLGNLHTPVILVAAIGFIVLLVLHSRKVKGAALISIIVATIIGIPLGVTKLPHAIFSLPQGLSHVMFHFDFMGALDIRYLPFLFAFFLPDFFSSLGTALGVGGKAGFLDENGDLPGIKKLFLVDSIAATIGSLFAIPVLITYLESSAGVEEGGRSGLTAITAAIAFLIVLFLTPIALMIPSAATAPILIYVGASMLTGLRNLDFNDMAEYIPAFLNIAFTVFTFNIANGISIAFISYVIIKLSTGRAAELKWGHYIIAILFVLYFYATSGGHH